MAITTLSSREFNQELGRAKKSAKKGPVFITDRGQPTHVLLNIEDYRKIAGKGPNLGELLSCPAAAAIDLELPAREIQDFRDADFD
jgi:prevent-host-death family protein